MSGDVKGDYTLEDALAMMEDIGYFGSDHEKKILKAFSLSKNLIVDEMEEFDNYRRLTKGEFYEFLARSAFLLLTQEDGGMSQLTSERQRGQQKKGQNRGGFQSNRSGAESQLSSQIDDGVPLIKKIEKLLQ